MEFLSSRLRFELEFVRALSDDIRTGEMDWRPPDRTNGETE
jgi:hypothetical protein